MSLMLFELCGAGRNVRFSPFAWRARLALCHKNLEFQGVPGNYHEKEQFGASGCQTYPVLKDGDKWIPDSWAIAEYLEETYADRPSLFRNPEGLAYTRFMNFYFNTQVHPKIFSLIAPDIHACLDPEDQDYFYQTRSKRIGMPLEDLIPLREKNLAALKTLLAPLRERLGEAEYLSGAAPFHPDYVAFSAFQWAKFSSPLNILEGEDTIRAWAGRMNALYKQKVKKLEAKPLL